MEEEIDKEITPTKLIVLGLMIAIDIILFFAVMFFTSQEVFSNSTMLIPIILTIVFLIYSFIMFIPKKYVLRTIIYIVFLIILLFLIKLFPLIVFSLGLGFAKY